MKYYFIRDLSESMMVSKQTVYNWFKDYLNGISLVYKSKSVISENDLNKVINGDMLKLTKAVRCTLKMLKENNELSFVEL